MTERAAHLVDRVLPSVRHRQCVLSLPFALRWRCAWDHELTRAVLAVFQRAVTGFYRRRASAPGIPGGQCTSVTVIQRFGSALNLNVHFHTLFPDGVYTFDEDGEPTFHALPPPSEEQLLRLEALISERVRRLLVRRGVWEDDLDGGRPLHVDDPPALGDLYEASILARAATGPRAGRPVRRLGSIMPLEPGTRLGRRGHGFDLHAGVVVSGRDRERREHLCRYLLRPPLAADRLEELPGGDLLLKLKKRWADGTTHLRFTPSELLERLAALIPRPRSNLVVYHGLFAANAKHRAEIVPSATEPRAACARPRNHTWAELLRRGLDIDGLECPTEGCPGRLAFVATIDQPRVVRRILLQLGLPAEPVRLVPARSPPFDFEAA